MLGLPLAACSSFTAYGVGPAFVTGGGGTAMGLVGEAAKGEGGSKEKSSTFWDTRARALLTPDHQQLAGLVGVSSFRWVGTHGALTGGIGGGLGVERADSTLFLNPIGQARAGTGFVLSSSDRVHRTNWFGIEAKCQPYQRDREKKLLTLGLAADVDGRFTRDAFFSVQLLVGIAYVSETGIAVPVIDPLPRAHPLPDCR